MKKVLISTGLTTQVYAPVTGALTVVDVATNPGLLASGAIGIYGVPEIATGVAALNLESLITTADTATTATGKVKYEDFDDSAANRWIRIAQGGEFPVYTGEFDRFGVTKITKQAYVAPVKQISYIGYNGTNGSLTLPTIVAGAEAAIIAIQKEGTTLDQIREQENYSTGGMLASTSAYDVINPIVNAVNNMPALSKSHTADIVTNGTKATVAIGTQITGTGAASTQLGAATLGSTTVTMTATTLTATSITTGDILEIGGLAYKVASVPVVAADIATITLDRPYTGASFSAVRLDNSTQGMKTVTSITEYGIKLVADTAGSSYDYAKQGVLENATLTYSTASSVGLGSGAEMVKIEQGLIAYRGQFDTYSKWAKQLPVYANASTNYEIYVLYLTQSTTATGAPHNKSANSVIMVAFPTGQTASTSFGTIIKDLCLNASCNF